MTDLPEFERRLREAVASLPAAARTLLLEILTSDADRRAQEIGALHAAGVTPATVEFLIDAEEDPYLRAVLVGMLREAEARLCRASAGAWAWAWARNVLGPASSCSRLAHDRATSTGTERHQMTQDDT